MYSGNTGKLLGCYEKGILRGITSGSGLLFVSYTDSKDICALSSTMEQKLVMTEDFPSVHKVPQNKESQRREQTPATCIQSL